MVPGEVHHGNLKVPRVYNHMTEACAGPKLLVIVRAMAMVRYFAA